MRRCAILSLLCLVSGLDVWAGAEYPAKPGERVAANELIVRLKTGANANALIAGYLPGAQIQALDRDHFRISVPAGLSAGVSTRIAGDPQVEYVEPNRLRHTMVAAPNDPNYASSWWLQTVQALPAWSLLPGQYLTAATAGAGRVKVAVLDTGADCTHPDFINTGGSSTDSAQGGQLLFSVSHAYVATSISSPFCAWQDDHGHGTHVSGIVAAATSNAVGVSGLGYPVQLVEFKVLDSTGSGFDTTISQAIRDAADAGVQVVSLSLGGAGYSQTLQDAITYAWQRNTLVVAAAGNDTSNELFFPAGANHSVGVSATDSVNNLAYFSNFGNSVQLAAPGLGILSTAPTYPGTSQGWLNYITLSGTSMATPFVSGLAGLVAMTTPNATAAAILQRMEQTASSLTAGGGWEQNFGFGIINASSAVSGTLRPAANGAIAGQIVNTAGSPISGAQITINSQTITTDTTGLYRFATLPAGAYPVTVSAPGKATQSLSATVAPGADTSFTVTMGVTNGKFTGTVTDQGAGVAGAIVQALSAGLITGVTVADQNGQYTLWVPGGTYDLRTSAIGRVTTTVSALTVGGGGTTSANLTLPRMGTIAGSVRDGSLNPVANAQVLVTGGSFSAAATTDVNGNYSLIGVPTGGPYSATASATGFPPSAQSGIAVSADVTTNVNFTMGNSTVATPTFNPPAGTYASTQNVTISSTTSGASIRYTTDGSTPTSLVGTVYSGAVSVSSSLTLKAIAYASGMTDSAVGSAAYTINSGGGPTWYSSSWSNRKAITIDHTKVSGSSSLTNFPVLISLASDANLQALAQSNGNDILFTASDGATKLNHEIESYSSSNGKLIAWVQVPSVSPTADTTIYVYYGNPAATNQQNKPGVWDSNYKGVWHLPNGTILSASDSTSNAMNGTPGSSATAVSGEINGGANVNASNGPILVSTASAQTFTAATFSAWVNMSAATDWAGIIFSRDPTNPIGMMLSGYTSDHLGYTWNANDYHTYSWDSGLSLPTGSWVYATISVTPAGATAYVCQAGSCSSASHSYAENSQTTNVSWYLGDDGYDPSNRYFRGSIDEARVSNTARSGGWIVTEYRNQNSPATFVIFGGQESGSGPGQAATPTFSPAAGTYASAQTVTISSTTSGASIRYTTDGSTPTSSVGTVYSGAVSVTSSLTLKAIAYKSGMTDSLVASAAYAIQVAAPTFNPPAGTYGTTQTVTISSTTSGASIRYTTDGSTPTSSVGTVYSGAVSVSSSLTLKAIAYNAGMADSLVASAAYAIQVAAPTFNPPAGTYGTTQTVTISSATSGASIRYTTDGSTPTSSVGTVYSGAVSVSSSLTLKAIAYNAGMTDSLVASAAYAIQVASPTFNPPAGTYGTTQNVTISSATSGASIRYTTDGSTPTSSVGTVYSGAVSVSSSLTLKAIAYKAGMADSLVASAAYAIQVAAPTFNPPAGTYGTTQNVTISSATSGASIRYTTDGSTPTSSVGTVYSGAVSVSSSLTLKAIAYKAGMTDSLVASAAYAIQVAAPTFNPPAGTYGTTQNVTISSATSGASIRYTTDGSTPTSSVGTVYSGAVSVSSNLTLKAIAYKAGMADSLVASAAYAIQVATPTFTPAAGTYSSAQSVAINTTTSGASIRYTTDGSTPTSLVGTVYSGAVSVSSSLTLKAIAYASGMTDSAVGSAAYTINSGGGPTWYSSSWSNRKAITIDHTKVSGSSSLTNFPVLISLASDANLQALAQSNGNDILFTASDGATKLNHEIESYSSSNGKLIAWVQVPSVSPTADTTIYVYYGNPAATNQQNKPGVWDSNYKGVWHLPNGTILSASDSTSNAMNGTPGSSATAVSGEINGGANVNASNGPILVSTASAQTFTAATFSAWVNMSAATDWAGIIFSRDPTNPIGMMLSGYTSDHLGYTWNANDYHTYSWDSGLSLPTGSWVYATISVTPAGATAYVCQAGSCSSASHSYAENSQTTNVSWYLGDDGYDLSNRYFRGSIDEARVSNTARSGGWIVTEYRNQNSPGTFYGVGPQQ